MSKLILPPPKFIPPEWHQANQHKYNSAEQERISSERLIDESDRLVEEAHETAKRTQKKTDYNIDYRIQDLKKWKEELDRKLTELDNENDTLIHYRNRLNRALEACNEPLEITQACLVYRQSRAGIDLVHDNLEIELIKELEVIKGVQNLLKRDLEEATEQIRRNREEMFNLGEDIKDKASAINIDSHCLSLHNNSGDIKLYPSKVRVEPNSTSPQNWRNFSNSNVKKAECERINSTTLRGIIDASLKTTCDDMKLQCKATNLALEDRVTETKRAKTLLENHLSKVNKEVGDQEKNISELTKAIEDKLSVMMVAQTRLNERSERPNVELCRDAVQYQLISEVNEITENVKRMKQRLTDSNRELVKLTRQQRILEEDIQVKTGTVYIDEVECGQVRSRIIHNYH